MKTAEKNANVQGTAAKTNEVTNKIQNRPSLTGKEAKDETIKDQKIAETPKVEEPAASEIKTNHPAAMDQQHTNLEPQPAKQEVLKTEEPVKKSLNLEQTLKSVGDLHRLSIQRLALIARIKTLEDFEVKLIEESDELQSNPFHGCKLIIKDDKGREFVTNTPNLIRLVAQFIFNACNEKLMDIEANIIFPQA
jgi:hypothetical protein